MHYTYNSYENFKTTLFLFNCSNLNVLYLAGIQVDYLWQIQLLSSVLSLHDLSKSYKIFAFNFD